jgi:hypothetical protein
VPVRVLGIDGDHVLIDVVPVRMMEVPAVEVVHMSLMLDRDVPAARAVLVPVRLVNEMLGSHRPDRIALIRIGVVRGRAPIDRPTKQSRGPKPPARMSAVW